MTNSDWWSKKLGQPNVAPAARESIPMPPSQQPMTRYTPPTPQQPTSRATSANKTDTCPSCGSGNYMKPNANTEFRCYDCGYPREQSGGRFGSLTGANVEGPTKAAVGNDATSNWNPTQVIGRIE